MEKNISYRRAEATDIERIKEILFNTLHEYKIALPDNYSVADIDNLASDNYIGCAFVLLRDDIVIGFVVLRPFDTDSIELKRFYLASSERKKGLGMLLLKCSLNYAKEGNYKYIRLETTSKYKEAVVFYRKNGFYEMPEVKTTPGHDLAFGKTI